MIAPLERDGIVGEEMWSASEHLRNSVLGVIKIYQARNIGNHEPNVVDRGLG